MAFPIVPRRRSGFAGNPTSLNLGELAVNTHDGSLYLGADVGVVQIGIPVAAGTELTEWTANGSASQFAPINGYNGTDAQGYLVTVQGIDQPFTVTSANGGTLVFDFTPPAGSLIRARAITQGTGGGGGSSDATSIQGVAVNATAPNDGELLKANADGSEWIPGSPLVLGAGAASTAANGIAIGKNAAIRSDITSSGVIAIGENSVASDGGISIGNTAATGESDAIAIGNSSYSGMQGIAIGENASALFGGIAIGVGSNITQGFGLDGYIAIGENAHAEAYGISIGNGSSTIDSSAIAVGNGASAQQRSIAIGENPSANHQDSIAIGYGVTTTAPYQILIGPIDLGAMKEKINEIITWINSNGGSITPL